MIKIALTLAMCGSLVLAAESGFSGNISLGGGFKKGESNIDPSLDENRLNSLNDKNNSTEAIPFLGIELSYKGLLSDDEVYTKKL